ncbi:DUF2251 domain-containing protein [Flectobacillus sp. DC10W]|uniref:DUF2251 domain-containing protein n=1 Tax=Flectobacillus longus TaxID=2984207 RepID=A0ABT6YRG5_9BACT|nr:DUF2251 domain-containing protein [Flectobacillus longus]MDI9865766.1 DUF2251 domain-containing protein [Flectobacillus longus]
MERFSLDRIQRKNGYWLGSQHQRGTDKHKPSTLKILWAEDESKAFLSINNYYHAMFDFRDKAGYCRNGFPEANNSWTKIKERTLTDRLIDNLSKAQ